MLSTRTIGYQAEEEAAKFLFAKGYTIIEKNYTIRGGEIDLIAKDGEDIVFVEVKYRRNNQYGRAIESVSFWKLKALQKTALFYLMKKNWVDMPYRFDLVTIDKINGNYEFGLQKNIID